MVLGGAAAGSADVTLVYFRGEAERVQKTHFIFSFHAALPSPSPAPPPPPPRWASDAKGVLHSAIGAGSGGIRTHTPSGAPPRTC